MSKNITDAITTHHLLLINESDTTFFQFVKERRTLGFPKAKDKQSCLSLGFGGG